MSIFPYWWMRYELKNTQNFRLCEYVLRRHLLSQTTLNLSGAVVSPYPTASHPLPGDKALEWIYQLLSVLDTKASALMRLNGVMLAAAAFMLRPGDEPSRLFTLVVAGSAIGSTISIAFCLLVVSVDWRFLGLATVSTKTPQMIDFTHEFFHLQKVTDFRQFFYRAAWTISFLSTVAFFVAIMNFFLSKL